MSIMFNEISIYIYKVFFGPVKPELGVTPSGLNEEITLHPSSIPSYFSVSILVFYRKDLKKSC